MTIPVPSSAGQRLRPSRALLFVMAVVGWPALLSSDQITTGTLTVQGSGLRVVTISATTAMDVAAQIQTEFAGRQGDQAPVAEGILAVGELSGPGIDVPIRLETTPGHAFQVPGLSREGIYLLQNVRLMRGGEFLQAARPSSASITVTDALRTTVTVRQLTPEEIRSRGIQVDARNYDVFEYTFSFIINGNTITIPFAVISDPRTHEVVPVSSEDPFTLPPATSLQPPRWNPPATIFTELVPVTENEEEPGPGQNDEAEALRPGIPAAIIIPNNLAVLHQFFAVGLMVTNNAPLNSGVTLTDLSATMRPPAALRTVRSTPAVAFGQAVPIVDVANGITFLVAQGRGESEWVMEGLRPGNHLLEIEIRATFKSPGQRDIPLRALPRASIVVHDPRFNVTFSHPQTVRRGIDYSTFSFITNLSPITQLIKVQHSVPLCSQNPAANVCRPDGTPDVHELTLPAGDMRTIEYKLRAGATGSVFATAGSVDGAAVSASIQLHMGVSESGIPLSPTTLLMPHYAQYVDPPLVSSYLELLGLGYSLATAPLTQATAARPRVIRTDVFQRALDIARAGQRIFIGEEKRHALSGMLLDLLGNSVELREWDQLRREEPAARKSSAAVFRTLETEALSSNRTLETFLDDLAGAQAWRSPFLVAVVDGPSVSGQSRAWAVSIKGRTSGRSVDQPNEAAASWSRSLPFADLSRFNVTAADRYAEMAVIGRWTEDVDVMVVPAATGSLPVHLVYPSPAPGSVFVAHFTLNALAGEPLRIRVERGRADIAIQNAAGVTTSTVTASLKASDPIRIIGARQDLHLDRQGHKVSVLFNRPVGSAGGEDFLPKFHGEVLFNRDSVSYRGVRPMSAAARQETRSIINLTFDHVLSTNAQYSLLADPLIDPLSGTPGATFAPVSIRIDNDRPAAILYGKVLSPDGLFVAGAEVTLSVYNGTRVYPDAPQYDRTLTTDGSFFFESVSRDVDEGYMGSYRLTAVTPAGKETGLSGVVRVPGKVHFVNLLFLGRGSAEGFVRYDSGAAVPGARVVAGSTMFQQFRETSADSRGFFRIDDLPVGPVTFSATDSSGNVAFAAAEIQGPGQILKQDLSIFRRPFPGLGTVRGIVRRSDTNAPVSGAQVGVFTQGYGLEDGLTGADGRFEFKRVPSGFVSVLAADWSISRESAGVDFDLAADAVRDLVMTLRITPPSQTGTVEGDVLIEDPLFPSNPSKYRPGANAIVRVEGGQSLIAGANGHFVFEGLPLTLAGKGITAHDPVTTRSGESVLPSLDPSRSVNVPILIRAGSGVGNIRVRLLSASGAPASGYRVIDPGFPPTELSPLGSGIYELKNAPVGRTFELWAIPAAGSSTQQFVRGSARVEFPGHLAALTLRLPGQGLVRVKLRGDIDVVGDVNLTYQVWEEAEQHPITRTLIKSTLQDGQAGFAEFPNVPALSEFEVSSAHPVYGKQSAGGRLGFDGDVASITLQLNRLTTIRGTVYEIDGRTPVPNAAVRLEDGSPSQGLFFTQPDGTFEFRNVPSNLSFRIVAEISRNNLFRTGFAGGTTPELGGRLENVSVILRRQGVIEGRVVYAQFKRYDPSNPSSNLPDDTPNDLSDNAAVPLARFFIRELDFPSRSFGTRRDPLVADATGRFSIGNLFEGPLRITAQAPSEQELRSDWTGRVRDEGEVVTALIGIRTEGSGPVTITVLDSNQANAPVANAEVTLVRMNGSVGTPFDFGTTDASGVIQFQQVPVGEYVSLGYAKTLGRSGSSSQFTVVADTGGTARVILEFSGAVEGKLSDPQAGGRGVGGAHIDLSAFAYETRTTTDGTGGFLFNGVREGNVRLSARDPLSNRRAAASRTLTQLDPRPFVPLELEPIETLFLTVFLPDDSGANSGVPAPSVEVNVTQRCSGDGVFRSCEFTRTLQGNAFQFTGLFRSDEYEITITEFGGQQRSVRVQGRFPLGSAASPLAVVLPAFGDVRVRVDQAGRPASNARVTAAGGGTTAAGFTDSTGVVLLRGIRLGTFSVQVATLDGSFSGSAVGVLSSQSTPAEITITLGAYAGLTGFVEAESGGPSVATRVTASFTRILEAFTDSSGTYIFQGIPTGSASTQVALSYFGPDGAIVGARQSVAVTSSDASRVIGVPPVKLDATPPQIISVTPSDGSTSVSPDTKLKVLFSERIDPARVTNAFFTLSAVDTNAPVATGFLTEASTGGGFSVLMIPPPPTAEQRAAGQSFPLRSNTLYRLVVSGEITDLTGHKIPATRGVSFVTADYTEPRVIRISPAVNTPLQAATTFEFKFNEPVDPAPWVAGGSGVMRLYKISTAGPAGAVVAEKPGRFYVGPSGDTLVFAPADPIEGESFYRVIFSGIRDLQGNPLPEQTFHFFSFDSVKPHVTVVSPVPAGYPLVSGVEYVVGVELRNGSVSGPMASDVAKVDYLKVEGSTATFLTTASQAPFAYRFVAPESPAGGTWKLRAIATDLSGNVSDPSEMTWSVTPNLAPSRVVVTTTPSGSTYAGKRVGIDTTFEDEGILVTVQATVTAVRSDQSFFTVSRTATSSRATVAAAWSAVHFDFDLPPDLKESADVNIEVRVTDARGQQGTGTARVNVLVDGISPVIESLAPPAESRFTNGSQFSAVAVVSDVGAGVADVTFTIDSQVIRVPATDPRVTDGPLPGTRRFSSGLISVPARNVDTRIAVVAAARDYHGNVVSRVSEVVYVGVNDPTRPRGSWLCPLDRSALPANQAAFPTRLRVEAIDDISIAAVNFYIPGATTPIPGVRMGLTSAYEAQAAVTTPPAGESLVLRAVISDADPTHDVEISVTVDAVQVDLSVDDRVQAVLPADIPAWTGKGVLVRGSAARLVLHAPLTLGNLILLDGGKLETLRSTTSQERKLDLTVLDHLTIDCNSSIDVIGSGYLGGWEQNPDGSGTRNEGPQGRTIGNLAAEGATNGASASHGGVGGESERGTAGSVYGSIANPTDPGSGGGGSTACCLPGAAGGGAIRIRGGDLPGNLSRFAVGGGIRADGGSGVGVSGAGSGGSIDVRAKTIVTSTQARISANGGDDDAANNASRGGGGGRIAIAADERFEVADSVVEARGGRNGAGLAPTLLDGGAGTALLRRPGQTSGTLIVSSFDASATTRQTRATPIGQIGSGISSAITSSSLTDATRLFSRAAVNQELLIGNLARAFTVVGVSTDGRTLLTDPSDGDLAATAGGSAVAYQGAVRFDAVTVGPRSLARFDDRLLIGDSVDDRARVALTPSSTLLLRDDGPAISLLTSVPPGASIPQDGALTATYDATSMAGIGAVEIDWTLVAVPAAMHPEHPLSTGPRTLSLPVPAATPAGQATLQLRAIDRSGRSAETGVLSFSVIPNLPPRIDRFDIDPPTLQIYPGQTVASTISAADDLAVRSISLTTQIGPSPAATQTVNFSQPVVTSHRFTSLVPIDTPGGQTLSLSVAVSDGFPSRAATAQTTSLAILRDTVAPQLTHMSPAAGTEFDEGSGNTIPVRVLATDGEVGVKTVFVQVGTGAAVSLAPDGTPNGWAVQLPVPSVDGTDVVPFQLTVTARDYEGNTTIGQAVSFGVRPLYDPNAPVIVWSCSGAGAMYPAGYPVKLRVNALGNDTGNASNAIQTVNFFIGSSTTPIPGVAVAGLPNEYQAVYTIPADAVAESTFLVRVIATNVAGKSSDLTTSITVVAGQRFTGNASISDATFDGQTILVDSGTLTITGAHTFDRLIVLEGAVVTHPPASSATFYQLELSARKVFIACGGSIDATGRGFTGAVLGVGRTWPNTTTGGSANTAGGSHGGQGGFTGSSFAGASYGSAFDPATPGSSGGNATSNCDPCNAGGGVIRFTVSSEFSAEGSVVANGMWSGAGAAGAGGSIRIAAPVLRGRGKISVDGGNSGNGNGGGGGGRIAIEAPSLLFAKTSATAYGGTSGTSQAFGAPGTVFLKFGSQINGELVIDNGSRTTQSATLLPGVGFVTVDGVGADFVRDVGGQLPGPDHLRGIHLIVGNARTPSWPIIGNDSERIRVSTATPLSVQTGQTVRGLYRLDALRLRNARVETRDLLELSSTVDQDTASTLVTGNLGAPVIDPARISMVTSSLGHSVAGSAGAVMDVDSPIVVTLTNIRSGSALTMPVAADGSFMVSAFGTGGDALTLVARDGHRFPLTSNAIPAGVLPSPSPSATEMNRTGWTSDANFRARLLAQEGSHLIVASRPDANGTLASDKLAIFNVSSASAPVFRQTIATGSAPTRDALIRNGWAYVVGDQGLRTVQLSSNPAVLRTPASSFCAFGRSLAVDGTYAFVGTSCGNGHLAIYEVGDPAAPRLLRQTITGTGVVYTALLSLGPDYLLGISPDRTGVGIGHDLVVINKQDINNLFVVADLDIPSFDATRARIDGSLVYLISDRSAKVVTVDLSNPVAPAIRGAAVLSSTAGGLDISRPEVFIAGFTSGILSAGISDPAAVSVTGSFATAGPAWDVTANGTHLYIAADERLLVLPAGIAPRLTPSLMSVTLSGTMAGVAAMPAAVMGQAPLTVEVRNARSGASISGVAVASDGSFQTLLPALPGDPVTVKAIDGAGRVTGPVGVGSVPFGTSTSTIAIPQSMVLNDVNFRARMLASEGTHLIVASRPDPNGSFGSDKLAVFDISSPGTPVFRQTLGTSLSSVRDMVIRSGWAYVVSESGMVSVQLSATPLVKSPSSAWCGSGRSVAVEGTYAFAGTTCSNGGSIVIYDVTDPAAPRLLRTATTVSGIVYSALVPLGTNYLIGISPDRPAGIGHDVVVIDKRDVNNLVVVADLDVPSFDAQRARLEGSRLYLLNESAGLAIVDLANPLSPVVRSVTATGGPGRGLDAAGSSVAVAIGQSGVSILDATSATAPITRGSQVLPGTSWDARYHSTVLYVATESGIAVIQDVGSSPRINTSAVNVAWNGSGSPILAAASAISGQAPLTVEIRNERSGASVTGLAVAVDGSFQTLLAALPGDPVTVKATDAAGRTAGPVSVGSVPFGTSTSTIAIPQSMVLNDLNFRARMLASEGSHLIVASRPDPNGSFASDKLAVFDISSPATPVFRQTLGTSLSSVRDMVIRSGWAYVVSESGMVSVQLSATPLVKSPSSAWCGSGRSVAVEGTYAFAGTTCSNGGSLVIYDVTDPAAPRLLRTATTVSGIVYSALVPLGTNYLIGISPDRPAGIGHDVVVIDKRDVNNLVVVADLDVPSFDAQRARQEGSRLYLFSETGGVAVVDVLDPRAPFLVSLAPAQGTARGFDVNGGWAAMAQGTLGVSFIDTRPTPMQQIGTHRTGASSWDVLMRRGVLLIAEETRMSVVAEVFAPPMIESLIAMTASGASVNISGLSGSIHGAIPLRVQLDNRATSVSVSGIPVTPTGSFSGSIAGGPGDAITMTVTDGLNRATTRAIGSAPFGTVSTVDFATPAQAGNDVNFRARRVAVENLISVITGGSSYGTSLTLSDKMLLFIRPDAVTPAVVRSVTVGQGGIRDVAIANEWGFVAANNFTAINLRATPPSVHTTADRPGSEIALATEGTTAFTSTDSGADGRINIWNIANPALPVFVGEKTGLVAGVVFRKLIPLGTTHLIGITPDKSSGVGHDVVIINRTGLASLNVVADIDVPAFDAFDGALDGTTLYLAGGDAGVAIVDLAVLTSPQTLAVIDTPGIARGISVASPFEIVVADSGGPGLTFIDTTDRRRPRVKGSQAIPGNPVDVKVNAQTIQAATEQHRVTVVRQ